MDRISWIVSCAPLGGKTHRSKIGIEADAVGSMFRVSGVENIYVTIN
jgi:hypothetical protein